MMENTADREKEAIDLISQRKLYKSLPALKGVSPTASWYKWLTHSFIYSIPYVLVEMSAIYQILELGT